MKDETTTRAQLISELGEMRQRIAELSEAETQRKWGDETLRAIVEGTASATGEDFFRSLVCNLASALHVRYSFVSEFTEVNTRVRTLAFWAGAGFLDNTEYDLADTPCEQVLRGEIRHYPEGVQALFPKDKDLVKLGAESYLAIPLIDPSGNVLGHLAVIDDKPMPGELPDMSTFKIFAARAGAELVRKRTEEALQQAKDELEIRAEERTAELSQTVQMLNEQITERKRAEEVLRESELWLRAIFNSQEDAVFVVTPDRKVVDMNAGAQRMLGYSAEEVKNLSTEIVHVDHEHHLKFGERIREEFARGEAARFEFQLKRKHGEIFPTEHTVSLLKNDMGQPIGIVSVVRDITERRRVEQEPQERRDANTRLAVIAKERGELQEWFNTFDTFVGKFDPNGAVIFTNEAPIKAGGLTKDDVFGKYFPDTKWWSHSEIEKARIVECIERAKAGLSSRIETNFSSADGTAVPIIFNCQSVMDHDGKVKYITAEGKTIIEETQLRAELHEIIAELEAFAYSVSHDLRTPLRAMQGFSQALLEDSADRLDPVGQDYAQRIIAAARHMDALIQDLLAYSRLSRAQLQVEPVSLESVMEAALTQLEAGIREKGADVTVEEPLPQVVGHPATLLQVIANLLTNAVKFVTPGVRPRVRVGAEERGEWVRLWVEDNGIGIAPEHQERIFRVFERLHGIETYPGTGIGLAVVCKGVERMGGRVGVESAPSRGSKFWVELPKVENKP